MNLSREEKKNSIMYRGERIFFRDDKPCVCVGYQMLNVYDGFDAIATCGSVKEAKEIIDGFFDIENTCERCHAMFYDKEPFKICPECSEILFDEEMARVEIEDEIKSRIEEEAREMRAEMEYDNEDEDDYEI